jgi:hypothetical protein
MSLINQKINNNYILRNNKTIPNNSKSSVYQNESLPTISYRKIPKINRINNRHNINPIKSPKLNKYLKSDLINPPSNDSIKHDFITKVFIENPPSPNDIIFILENYLKRNNINSLYKSDYEINTMIFSFEEEKVALDFINLLFKEKKTNPHFYKTNITVNLTEKKNKVKFPDINNKVAKEVLGRLYYGYGYEKKEKPKKKIYGNFSFGIESPFYYVNSKKIKKSMSESNSKEKNISSRILKEHKGDKFGYVGYDGKPLKSYKNFKINVLNTSYKPMSKFILRKDDKKKWMSPLDFKMY